MPEDFELRSDPIAETPAAEPPVDDTETAPPVAYKPENGVVFTALRVLHESKGKRWSPSTLGTWASELLVTHDEADILAAIAKVDADTKINAFGLQLSHVRALLPKAKAGKRAAHWGIDGSWGGDWEGVPKARRLQAAGHMQVCFFPGNMDSVSRFLTDCYAAGIGKPLLDAAREHRARAGDLSEDVCVQAIKAGAFPEPVLPRG